jgi:nitroreductase/Pyruvate/2-oxoacid:ferredoxin oxidoreductase delta subunit
MPIERSITTTIDQKACDGCGRCVPVCPKEAITMVGDKAAVVGTESLNCGHCAAVCPQKAIRVTAIDETAGRFQTFSPKTDWLPHGDFDTAALVNLMQSRRSCRNFRQRPVEGDILEDLIRIGASAPSGSNCQMWTFLVLPNRQKVEDLAQRIGTFFQRINRLAEKSWLRNLLKMVGKPQLADFYRDHYATVQRGLQSWQDEGRDLLFHGAPAMIVVGSRKKASCPVEDSLLATQNILLGAHSMGLGTCLIGFAVEAIQRDAETRTYLGLVPGEDPFAVIALGYPREKYMRVAGRKPITIRYV